jgi:hypothetical protein
MAKSARKNHIRRIMETCIIYESRKDKCWIAHSLRTDQIGTGNDVIEALADLLLAVDQLLELAEEESNIEVFRSAPSSIQNKVRTATHLPKEIYDIAHRKARGDWPLEIDVSLPKHGRFITELSEPICV